MTAAVLLGLAIGALIIIGDVVQQANRTRSLSLAGRIAALAYMLWLLIFWRVQVGNAFIGVVALILIALVVAVEGKSTPGRTPAETDRRLRTRLRRAGASCYPGPSPLTAKTEPGQSGRVAGMSSRSISSNIHLRAVAVVIPGAPWASCVPRPSEYAASLRAVSAGSTVSKVPSATPRVTMRVQQASQLRIRSA